MRIQLSPGLWIELASRVGGNKKGRKTAGNAKKHCAGSAPLDLETSNVVHDPPTPSWYRSRQSIRLSGRQAGWLKSRKMLQIAANLLSVRLSHTVQIIPHDRLKLGTNWVKFHKSPPGLNSILECVPPRGVGLSDFADSRVVIERFGKRVPPSQAPVHSRLQSRKNSSGCRANTRS